MNAIQEIKIDDSRFENLYCKWDHPWATPFLDLFGSTSDGVIRKSIPENATIKKSPIKEFASSRRGLVYHPNEDRFIVCGSLKEVCYTRSEEFEVDKQQAPFSGHQDNLAFECLKCYAVIDGHQGSGCADFIQQNLLGIVLEKWEEIGDTATLPISLAKVMESSMLELEIRFMNMAKINGDNSGACIVAALVFGEWLCVSNVGDAGAVLLDGRGRVIKITESHSAKNRSELLRLVRAGGRMNWDGRIEKKLIPSRTIGDQNFKAKHPDLVISAPETFLINIDEAKTKSVPSLVLASDGLWDIGWENANFFLREHTQYWRACHEVKEHGQNHYKMSGFQDPATSIANYARFSGSTDDITVIFVHFG